MRKTILERKNWEIFLVFIAIQFLVLPTIVIMSWLFGPGPDTVTVQLIEFFASGTLYFSYPIIVGHRLNHILAGHENLKLTSVQVIRACIIVMTISYVVGLSWDIAEPWAYLIPLTAIPCFLVITSWPARPLKSIELRRNAGIWEYIPEAFQFILWPLAVWWIQPRLNDIDKDKIQISE
jgi:hypothetical protein